MKASTREEDPIHGDVLEAILSHVPLIDLVPVSSVSKSWSAASLSSLLNVNTLKPWLIVHSQSTRAPHSIKTHAYDPRSHVWVEIPQPSDHLAQVSFTALRSSCSNFVYMLSPCKFSLTLDPLCLTWRHADSPPEIRVDPIVGRVGDVVIVAGGTCEFEDDPLAVGMYDIETDTWRTTKSMPASFKESASATWLSAIVYDEKLFVMEKSSGVTHWFDPKTENWSQPYDLLPDRRIVESVLVSSSTRPILIGLIGTAENVQAVKIYKIGEDFHCQEEIGEMPSDFIEKLRSETFGISKVCACMAGNFFYLYNEAAMEEVVVGEMEDGGGAWSWWSVKVAEVHQNQIAERVVLMCGEVGLEELQRVMRGADQRFTVKGAAELTRSS